MLTIGGRGRGVLDLNLYISGNYQARTLGQSSLERGRIAASEEVINRNV